MRWLLLLALLLALWPLPVHADACADALATVQQGERWQVLQPCATVEATVEGTVWASSNGAYWYLLRDQEGQVWGKFYPGLSPAADLRDGDSVRLTGPLVSDRAYDNWREIVPVVAMEIVSRAEQPALSLSLGHIAIGEQWLHVVTAYCQAEQGCGLAVRQGDGWQLGRLGYRHGDAWTWLLPERVENVGEFVRAG